MSQHEQASRFSVQDIDVISLRKAGLDSDPAIMARRWIEGMTLWRDHEDGPDFWRWIEDHHIHCGGSTLYDTFLLRERASDSVVATGSIVPDDRGAGKTHGITGPWIGGVNVRGDRRGRNLGHVLMAVLHGHIQHFADTAGADVPVNLFTSAALARSFFGPEYEVAGKVVVFPFGSRVWCRRVFVPSPQPGALRDDN
jgi:hypothetical protein